MRIEKLILGIIITSTLLTACSFNRDVVHTGLPTKDGEKQTIEEIITNQTIDSDEIENEKEEIDLTDEEDEIFIDSVETLELKSFSVKSDAEKYSSISMPDLPILKDYDSVSYEANSSLIRAIYKDKDGNTGYIVEHGLGTVSLHDASSLEINEYNVQVEGTIFATNHVAVQRESDYVMINFEGYKPSILELKDLAAQMLENFG